jgi:hypothetical protein
MSTSFISKDDMHGFWINDALTQIICWGFLGVIEDQSFHGPAWMREEFKKYINNCSLGLFVGFTTLSLKKYIQTEENVEQFNHLIASTKSFFLDKGDFISTEQLNSFQTEKSTRTIWIEPFETKRAIKILDFIEDVVNDRLTIKVSDEINYKF